MGSPERLVVGRVLRPRDRGELSVEVLSDAPDRFGPGAELGVGDPDGPEPPRPAVVRAARLHLGRLLLSLEGQDRDAADRLRGAWLSIPVAEARLLDPGEFWPHQLVGLAVVDHQGRERGRGRRRPRRRPRPARGRAAGRRQRPRPGRGRPGHRGAGGGPGAGRRRPRAAGRSRSNGRAGRHRHHLPGSSPPAGHRPARQGGGAGLVEVRLHDLRDWATDRHRSDDDALRRRRRHGHAAGRGSTPSTPWRRGDRPGCCSPPTAAASTTASPSGWPPSPG